MRCFAPRLALLITVVFGAGVIASCGASPAADRLPVVTATDAADIVPDIVPEIVPDADGESDSDSDGDADAGDDGGGAGDDAGGAGDDAGADTSADAEVDASAGADGGAGEAGAEVIATGPCPAYCQVLSLTACPPPAASCVSECERQVADLCGDELRAAVTCEATLRPGDFTCDSRGRLVLDPTLCQTQESALLDCLIGQ